MRGGEPRCAHAHAHRTLHTHTAHAVATGQELMSMNMPSAFLRSLSDVAILAPHARPSRLVCTIHQHYTARCTPPSSSWQLQAPAPASCMSMCLFLSTCANSVSRQTTSRTCRGDDGERTQRGPDAQSRVAEFISSRSRTCRRRVRMARCTIFVTIGTLFFFWHAAPC